MKKLVLGLIVISMMFTIFSCGKQPMEPKPKRPKEPEEPPPPPPPPPEKSPSSPGGGPIIARVTSMDKIARRVLAGEYGEELKNLLAHEVSRCVGQMASEGVVDIQTARNSDFTIAVIENRPILFDIGYIAEDILQGKYGAPVRETLQYILSSPGSIDFNRNVDH